jgi:hypothetical protein
MLAEVQPGSYSKSSVADLSAALLVKMQPDELISVIRAADLPGQRRSQFDRQPEQYDRCTLLRLAHIARRCCRTQEY